MVICHLAVVAMVDLVADALVVVAIVVVVLLAVKFAVIVIGINN